jgi:uncharacterized RDD family membrane protein YckC
MKPSKSPATPVTSSSDVTHNAPIARRIWSSLYELALLFGINFVTALVVQILLTLLNVQLPNWGHSLIFFGVMGLYFSYCWTHGGQTLAQRTWRLKVTQTNGNAIGYRQAWLRYTLAYLGVLPAFLITWTQIHNHVQTLGASAIYTLAIGLALLNWLALLGTGLAHPQKIALHERLSGTRTAWLKD